MPHMFDMQALKFPEQRSIATEFGFIEMPFIEYVDKDRRAMY
jgi:hypothetical protein